MDIVTFPSKLTAEVSRLTFNFLNVMPPGSTINEAAVSISVLMGQDDGSMSTMLQSDTLAWEGGNVTVLCQQGTAGVIYNVTASVQLNNASGPVYQQVGRLAVMPGDAFTPIPPVTTEEIVVWADPNFSSGGPGFDFTQTFNSLLMGASSVEILGYWPNAYPDEFGYGYPPSESPLEVETDDFGAYVELETPIALTVPESSDFWQTGTGQSGDLPTDISFLVLMLVDGDEIIGACTNFGGA